MATISGAANERIFSIPKWLGLNEHPDGDSRLKIGEASKMDNWRVTRDGNLKRRPGQKFIAGFCEDYTAVISPGITAFGSFPGTEMFTVYLEADADTIPGAITLGRATSSSLTNGVLGGLGIDLVEGVLDATDSIYVTMEDDVLKDTALINVDLIQLEALCSELEDGEFYYLWYDEVPYAIDSSSFATDGDLYRFGGYRVTPAPVDVEHAAIKGMWTGMCNSSEVFLVACAGNLWNLYDAENRTLTRSLIGSLATDKGVSFFPFDNKVYILNGYEYLVYNGETLLSVEGYRPLVAIAISPDLGGGSESGETTGEYVNLLNGKRRVWLSPDGTNATFTLPEKALMIDAVINRATGASIGGYSFTANTDQITFSPVLDRGVNTVEVQYSVKTHAVDDNIPDYRQQVASNLFSELYSGTTDTRIFLYGNGTNKTLYSGMDYDGMPRADYFPDQYEVRVGDSNTPITAMIRHYGNLVTYKTRECWNLQHGVVELATGDLTPSIYCTPVNKDKGNVAPGQVRLVNNSPVTCSGSELYHWINSSYYTSNLTRDERQTRRISDRVQASIKDFDFEDALMWDDDDHQEFYIVQNNTALVWNYAADAWYKYSNFDAVCMCNFHGQLYLGSSTGRVVLLTDEEMGDEGIVIQAYWESGAMDFGADYMRKYASTLWVGLKPEAGTSVDVSIETDRKNTFSEKIISSEKAKISGQPFMVKTKLKAKKFEYYRLLLTVDKKMPAVTVTNVDIRVRQTGYAK